jgi:hypothetical protein
MISDFCMSLSRKKEDKVNGTGRLHVMKNRYGMDGLTFNATVDTTMGHIELQENNEGANVKDFKPLSQKSADEWDNDDLRNIRGKLSDFEDLL